MHDVDLLGITDGFALFGHDSGITVVVNLGNLDVFDPVPKISVDFSRWGDAGPEQVPTEAYELAAGALISATPVDGTDVMIAGGAKDKRSFAIPKAVQAEAQKALEWHKQHKRGGTDVGLNTARTLAKGGSIGIQKVRHCNKYFARHEIDKQGKGWSLGEEGYPSNGRISWSMWGSDAAWKWTNGILRREKDLAVLAELDFTAKDEKLLEDVAADSEPDVPVDAGEADPNEPHEYIPDLSSPEYACEVCGGEEDLLIHAVGSPSEAAVTAAAGTKLVATADQFFNVEVDSDDVIPDFYLMFEARADGTPSMITGILAHRVNDTWAKWSRHTHNWSDTAEPSDAFPVDNDSAYETAILFDTHDKDAIPAQEIDQFEWDQVQKALPYMPDFKAPELEDLDFCVVMGEDKIHKTVIIEELYMRDKDGTCWRWNPVDVEWQKSSRCPKDCTSVDADTAREAAARLSAEASSKAAGSQQRKFHGLPQASSLLKPTKPGGPLRTPPVRTPQGPYEFDSAFNRAAWINGQRGGVLDGPPGFSPGSTATSFSVTELDDSPGVYSPEERSKNASKQPRDANGRFIKSGTVVHVNNNSRTARISSIDRERQRARVKYDDGTSQDVNFKDMVKVEDGEDPGSGSGKKFDPYAIRGKPRATRITPKALLPKLLEPMNATALKKVITDYQGFIDAERKRKLESWAALTPETSDVKPLYLAMVDELDKSAVLDLFALVPKTKTSNDVMLYIRSQGGWTRDDKTLEKMRSTTPPPLVTLDSAMYRAVLKQVDSFFQDKAASKEKSSDNPDQTSTDGLIAALVSRETSALWDDSGWLIAADEAEPDVLVAGGIPGIADTPGDVAAARRLRRYWLRGRGAAKIRWNTPGDWQRCVKHLSKYMGPRAKGYCQHLHKSATGVYTGSKFNVGNKRGLRGDGSAVLLSSPTSVLASAADVTPDTQFLALLEVEEPSVIDLAELSYRQAGHKLRVGERFLVNGGDGVYALSVLEPTSTIGWEGAPAVLVARAETSQVDLLQEAGT